MQFIIFVLLVAIVSPAFASDGVVEINQTCAVQTGCFSGDTAGFPVTIFANPGRSFRLTSDLIVPSANKTGIEVRAGDLSIDLAGFSIRGPNSCGAPPINCQTLEPEGVGVHIIGDRVQLSNGSIVGHGSYGIFSQSGNGQIFRNLRVAHNPFDGMFIDGSATIIEGNIATRNGGSGITIYGSAAMALGNITYQNGAGIFSQGQGATISRNITYENTLNGITAAYGSTVSENTSYLNGGSGIQTAYDGSNVQGNTVRQNGAYGLQLSAGTAYRENLIAGNSQGTVFGVGVLNLGDNACNGALICP